MNSVQAFFFGFVMAGLIGWLSSTLSKSFSNAEKAHKRIFSDIPNPALKAIRDSSHKSVGTDIEQSPLQILTQGCLTIIGQLLLQVILLSALTATSWFGLSLDITPEFFLGVIFAAVFGLLLGEIITNWKKITDLYKKIFTPPSPSLDKKEAPNKHYVAAKPTSPAFAIIIDSSLEISWRLVWQLMLFYLLYLSSSGIYTYLADKVAQAGG